MATKSMSKSMDDKWKGIKDVRNIVIIFHFNSINQKSIIIVIESTPEDVE